MRHGSAASCVYVSVPVCERTDRVTTCQCGTGSASVGLRHIRIHFNDLKISYCNKI